MSTMKIQLLFGAILLVACQHIASQASPWLNKKSSIVLYDSVEVRLVGETNQHARVKRTLQEKHLQTGVEPMPDHLHFRLQLGARQVDLQMGKSRKGLSGFPVFVIEDGQIKRKELKQDNTVELYANHSTGSSFVVRKSGNRAKFILEGFFYDGLERLYLTHNPSGGLHLIHKQAREVDLRDDYINTVRSEGLPEQSTREPIIYKSSTRFRRESEALREHEIRLFMVTDYQEYLNWWRYYQRNATLTEIEMNHYYSFVANSINIRYSSINDVDPTFKVEIVVTGLLIVNSPSVSSWTESYALKPGSNYVDAYRALDAFGVWVRRMHTDLPLSDHWMLFTGFNIYTERNPIVAGLARLSSMCSLTSISIIEQDNTGSVGATAAHELGHSLGSLHDGEELDCFDDDNYVMSKKLRTPDNDIRASRPWQFSMCSIRAFKRFLSKVQCTNKSSRAQSILSSPLSPGQVFSADQQCQLAFGNGSYLGRQLQYMEGYSTICRRMYCSVPNVPGLYQAIFPFEKTSCGDRKWCQRGRCENHRDAPTMEDHCPQGDDPTAPCVQEDCPYYTPRTKIVYCCHTCRSQQQQRRPAVSDIFRISAVQRNQSPNSGLVNADQTTASTPPLVSTESTTHESQDRTSVATEAFNDQDLTTAASQFVDTKDTSNVTNNAKSQNNKAKPMANEAKPQANETNPQANEANSGHSTPKVFSDITESSFRFPDESTRATTDSTSVSYVLTSETSPMTASEIPGGTKSPLLEPNTSKDLQDPTTRSPSEQTPQVRVVLLGRGDGLKVDNIPRPNKTRVHQNISGDNIQELTGEPLSLAGVTKTNNSGIQMQPANQETSYSPSRGNLALHLGLSPFNANSDLISNSVHGVNPESDIILNMIHKGVSILALAGDDTRADGVKLNIVSSVKEPAIEDGTVSKSNTSLTGNNAIVTENLPPDPRSDMTRTVVSSESNHISLAPSAHIPRLMATSFWPPATTPDPNYENSQKGSGILDETGYLVNSMSLSRLASTDSSLDKVLATSISLDPKLKLEEKSPANGNVYSDVSSSVQKPVMMPSEFLSGSNPIRYALDKVSTLETPPATASSVEGVNAGPLLPFWEMPSQSLPESVHTNNMPDLANLNYRARWWNGVLAQRSHQALEVSDYAVNWPNDPTQTDARMRTRVSSRLPPSGPASSSPADSYIPRGHKVEIISFQPHLKRFLEEMASVDSAFSRFEPTHLTTTDKPNVLLNCRFQCVFFRELVSPAVDRSDEFVNYLIRRLSVSNRIPAPSVNMNRVSDIGLRASLQRMVAR